MGWASGFRAGSDVARQAIDTYRQAALQRDIEAAQGISAQEVKAPGATQVQVDAANAETAGLAAQDARDFGLEQPLQYNQAQVGQATAPSRFKLGNQMMDTAPTEQQVAGVRRKAMVDAMTRFDPVQGMRMGMELERDDREKTRFGWEQNQQPLRQKQLEQQTRTGEIQLDQSERAVQVQGLVDEVAKMPIEALKAYAAKLNTNESNLPFLMVGENKDGYKFLTIDPKTGRPTGKEFTVNDAQLRELAAASVLGMSGYGAESMQRLTAVNKDVADIVAKMNATTAQVVGSENDALSKGRQDGFRQQGLNLQRQQVNQQGAYQRGMLDLRRQELGAKQSAATLENDINGVLEGYQAAMAAGPQGREAAAIYAREYDQLRAIASQRGLKMPPNLAALQAAQKGGSSKPVKVEDPDQRYLVDGQLRVSDGRGGYIAENGILPDERGAALAKAGVPQSLIPQLRWNQDGTAVGFRGRAYDMADPQDVRALISDSRQLGANDIAVDEYQRQPNGMRPPTGFGPKITYGPDPAAPSIYAGPEEWADYRLLQQNR